MPYHITAQHTWIERITGNAAPPDPEGEQREGQANEAGVQESLISRETRSVEV